MAKYKCNDFETETDEERYTFQCEGINHPVATYDEGIMLVKQALKDGCMSRLIIERGCYVKYAYALDHDGHFLYKYSLIWKQVN